jgi:hypothetical protein
MKTLTTCFFAVGVSCCVSSCNTTNPLPKDFYNSGPNYQLPPISFFMKKPSGELAQICKEASCSHNVELVDGILDEFTKAHVFQNINAYKNASDYQLQVVASRVDPNDAAQFAKTMVSAATLFVVPMNMKHEYRSEFILSWQGISIAEYQFSIPHDEVAYLFKDINQSGRFASESIAARFLSTAQGEGIFTSEYLYEKLKAEDYHRDLSIPNKIGDYVKSEMLIYPNPFLGAQVRFRNPKIIDQNCDIFVYPIRRIDWRDTGKALDEEMASIFKDVDLAVKSGAYNSAAFNPATPFLITEEKQIFAGIHSHGSIVLNSGESVASEIYLFIMKDKFLKFRITSKNIDSSAQKIFEQFVIQTLPQINVPAESFFIGRVRQNRRNTTIQ